MDSVLEFRPTIEQKPRRLPPVAVLSFVLLLAALFIVAQGIADVSHGLESLILAIMAGGGVVVGWLLALTPIGAGLAILLSMLAGSVVMLFLVGRIGNDFVAMVGSMLEMAGPVWRSIVAEEVPDWTPVAESAGQLASVSVVVFSRAVNWLTTWITGSPTFDPVAAALIWSLLIWAVAAWAGWMLKRHNHALIALLPASVLMIATFGYLGADSGPVIWLLAVLLVLLALARHTVLQREWLRRKVKFSERIWQGVGGWALLISVVLVSMAAALQDVSLDDLLRTARTLSDEQEALRETVTDALGLRDQRFERQRAAMDQLRAPGLPRRHLIGSGPELSEQIVMEVRNLPIDDSGPISGRFYLRSSTYDLYTSRGWITSETDIRGYGAGERIRPESLPGHRNVLQEISVIETLGPLLHAAGPLVTADQEFTVQWRGDNDDFGAIFVEGEDVYQSQSLILDVTADELRAADQIYPDWVSPHYLELPSTLPDRVFVLARDLTATEATPYDRALAIERYLRTFPYTLDVVPPPAGQDVVDYFLFDLQEGYCDFYASSMVVLARASGLPARLVVGYIAEQYDEELQAHVISEAEAHSWAEIYFPGYGWVEFEPTGGREAVYRSEETDALSSASSPAILDEGDLDASSGGIEGNRGFRFNWILLTVPAAIVGAAFIFWERLRYLRLSAQQVATHAYPGMRRLASRLSIPLYRGYTPSQFADVLGQALKTASQRSAFVESAVWDVSILAKAYEDVSYRKHPGELPEKALLMRSWSRIRRRLWFLWFEEKIRSLRIPFIISATRSQDGGVH
jgi:transglutaminase-like putative cysteine protease